jgi:hypothetical protein
LELVIAYDADKELLAYDEDNELVANLADPLCDI